MIAEDYTSHLAKAAALAGVSGEVVAPTVGRVRNETIGLRYLDWGNDGAEPVLFLHGGALTAHTWDLVCVALRDGYRCIAMDLRGHGDSDWSDDLDYSLPAHRSDVLALLSTLEMEGAVLVGQSWGGAIALSCAARSGSVRALAVVDVGLEVRGEGAKRIHDFVSAPDELDSVEEFVQRAQAFNPRRDPELLRFSLLHNLRRTSSGRWTWKYDRRPFQSSDPDARRDELRTELMADVTKLDRPALVVRGADSDVLSPEGARSFAAMLRARTAEVPGAGHNVQGDAPAALALVLRGFLDEVTAS